MNAIGTLIQLALDTYLKTMVQEAINLFLQFLAAISGIAAQVLDLPVVNSAIIYTQALAGSILAAKVAYEAWMTYILRQNGDPDADPGGLLFRTARSAAIIGALPWLIKLLYEFGTNVASDIAKLPGVDFKTAGSLLQDVIDNVIASNNFMLFVAIAVTFALIIFVVILIQTFIRAGELAVAAVVGSFMALGLTNNNSVTFSTWFRETLAITLSQSVQMFLVKVSFFTLTSFNFAGVPMFNLLLLCGFLWVTYKSPSILKQYVYSTGVGKAAGGAVSSVGSMALARKVFTKGV